MSWHQAVGKSAAVLHRRTKAGTQMFTACGQFGQWPKKEERTTGG